ncbi:hypothetical protein AG1IA_08782 [Rhizoctonia solani AG-1 IA]|uniref:Uncharacterized protein n=1 Tax=Thanatephorus cucumeris (strain AG1-IA) TaxID=983506 RepID=L8WLH3_THACA|nr:hypothetical protein AG1IA_08782 [Rhizoctonia solani AG-1 IA]
MVIYHTCKIVPSPVEIKENKPTQLPKWNCPLTWIVDRERIATCLAGTISTSKVDVPSRSVAIRCSIVIKIERALAKA